VADAGLSTPDRPDTPTKDRMAPTTHSARITGPVPYEAEGKIHHVPLGACLVEQVDEHLIDIVWGANGQRSAALPADVVLQARASGNLVLLD